MHLKTLAKRVFGMVLLGIWFCALPLQAAEIQVYAAASLKEVIGELANQYIEAHPGTKAITNFAASGVLARQIEAGAPANLFISADTNWIGYLQGKQLLDSASTTPLAYNRLVVVGPKSASGLPDSLQGLTRVARIALGNPASVPAGAYAEQALQHFGLLEILRPQFLPAKDVREALLYAELGEAQAAFVYATDARLGKKTRTLFVVPSASHPKIVYPMALVQAGKKSATIETQKLYSYLLSTEAREILKKYGFEL